MKTLSRILGIILFLFAQNALASHVRGGEITYQYKGDKKYEITVHIYRECQAQALPNNASLSVFNYANGRLSVNMPATRVAIIDITPQCPDSTRALCNTNTTTSFAAVELHVFKAILDFDSAQYKVFLDSGVCEIGLRTNYCCRSTSITTGISGIMYVESMLNICINGFKNSSVQVEPITHQFIPCNSTYMYNYGGVDFQDYDSISYELVEAQDNYNYKVNYSSPFSYRFPMTPFCPGGFSITCNPYPNLNPSRGFYFNKLNGDMAFLASRCSEVGVVCVRANEFRKDSSGNWKRIGFVTRDIMLNVVNGTSQNYQGKPKFLTSYTFKSRDSFCINFNSDDRIMNPPNYSNLGDSIMMRLSNPHPSVHFSYEDSSKKVKTARICVNITDKLYESLGGKSDVKHFPIVVETHDNYCPYPYISQATIDVWIAPLDSNGVVNVKTYDDVNRNQVLDAGDTLIQAKIKLNTNGKIKIIETSSNGIYTDTLHTGLHAVSVLDHPYYAFTSKDSVLNVGLDSNHTVSLLITKKPGIYGRLYEDANSNCKYDHGEKTYKSIKVVTSNGLYSGITDQNGFYHISAPAGNYILSCENLPSKYNVLCPVSKTINLNTNGTSAYHNNDFAIQRNVFNDLSVGVKFESLSFNYNYNEITFICHNFGDVSRYNVQLICPLQKGDFHVLQR
ncbi:MAG: hypothetical protein R2852_07875 [Bacteroidia bacterium]